MSNLRTPVSWASINPSVGLWGASRGMFFARHIALNPYRTL